MSDPIMPLDKNGLMFADAIKDMEEELAMAEAQEELKKEKRVEEQDMTGELLDCLIQTLSLLRKRF